MFFKWAYINLKKIGTFISRADFEKKTVKIRKATKRQYEDEK
jgi:hypothetical protein